MSLDLLNYWNTDHSKRTIDKGASDYAIQKEQSFPRSSYILDIGGGRGADAVYFAKKGHKVVLIDVSDTALTMAKERATRDEVALEINQVTLGNDRLPFNQNTFDIVYSRLALHYFGPDVTTIILSDIYKVLKPGGTTYLTLKSPNDKEEMDFLTNNAKKVADNVFDEAGFIQSRYTSGQLRNFLLKANISTYEVKEIEENLFKSIEGAKSGNIKFVLNEITIAKM